MKSKGGIFVQALGCTFMFALFTGAVALAQGTLERVPDSGAPQDPPGTRANGNQAAQVGEMEVLNGPISFHTRNYISFGVLAHIRSYWRQAVNEKGLVPGGEEKTVAVEFSIRKDGTLDSRRVAESSGDAELDRLALDTVAKSAPFMAVPEEFSGDSLKLRCHFYLNPGRRIRGMSRAPQGEESADVGSHRSSAEAGTIDGNGGPTHPVAIYTPDPEYSEKARKAGVEGAVLLKVKVTETGEVADLQVVKGLGSGLDEKAMDAVRRWKFKPGLKDGSPVASEINVEASFHLYNRK
jgi:TonB family protein